MAFPSSPLAYAGVDGQTHQANFNQLSSSGHRMIDVCVSGSPSAPSYAACWVKDDGGLGRWVARHGVDQTQFDQVSNDLKGQAYTPTCVSVTGTPGNEIFAGIWAQNWTSTNFVEYDLTNATLVDFVNINGSKGIVPIVVEAWGTPTDPRYMALFSDSMIKQNITWWYGQNSISHQETFNAEISKPGWRPLCVTGSQNGLLCSTYCDYQNGAFQAFHGLDLAGLEHVLQNAWSDGHTVINLQAYGDSSPRLALYTVITVNIYPTLPRQWSIVTSGILDPATEASIGHQLDNIMQTFMRRQSVRRAQLAVGRGGNVLLERACTWAESVYPPANTSDRFLLASVSKAFCEAAVQVLYDRGTIMQDTPVYVKLGFDTSALQAVDPRLLNVTVQQLLDHYGGMNTKAYDPVFHGREISQAISGDARVITAKDMATFMSQRPLDYDPGSQYIYSNYGYVLLSYLVEHVSGQTYHDFLSDNILKPEKLDVSLWPTNGAAHVNDVIKQEDNYVGPSALQPASPPDDVQVAYVYGGDDLVKEACVGPSSLAASASTLVRFLSNHGELSEVKAKSGRNADGLQLLGQRGPHINHEIWVYGRR